MRYQSLTQLISHLQSSGSIEMKVSFMGVYYGI